MGFDRAEDAGVYRLAPDLAVVQTIDFLTPIVDDPYTFGQIAAANAMSDVYAMGGRPVTAMNIVAFPISEMDIAVLREILAGGLDKMNEAGVTLVGGHSVEDPELKYGLSVTGVVHPDEVVTNAGARAGDRIVLTKPVGTGIVNTAMKAGLAGAEAIDRAQLVMAVLNRAASEAMIAVGVHACTDVTGFGLVGHLCEMIDGLGLGIVIEAAELPVLPGALEYAGMGLVPAGAHRNRKFREPMVALEGTASNELIDVLHDPQTSGGLLISVSAERVDLLLEGLLEKGVTDAAVIGEVVEDRKGALVIR